MASRQKLCPRWDILSRGIFLRTKSIGQLFHFFNKMNNSSCLRNSGRRFPQCQCVKPFENEASFRWRIGLRQWLAQPLTCYSREWHCTSSEWKHEPCIISFELLAHVLLILISAMISASEWRILKGLNDSNENARNDVVKNDVFFSVTRKNDSWFCTNLTCSMVSTWKSIFDYTFRANFIRPRCFSKIDLIVLLSDQFRSSSM